MRAGPDPRGTPDISAEATAAPVRDWANGGRFPGMSHGTHPLPLSPEQITPTWLSAALGVPVEQVEIDRVISGTATKALVDVRYATEPAGLPERVCVKGGFTPELRPIMAVGYQTEALFYRDVAAKVPDGLPTCYFAAIEPESDQGIVILEDLSTRGARFVDARQAMTPDQVAQGLLVQAQWHALSDLDEPWLKPTPHFRAMVAGLLTPEHWDAQLARGQSDLVLSVLDDRERIRRGFEATWAFEESRPRGLTHGDANPTNTYFDATGRPRFVDWQFAALYDWAHDVGLFLIGALTTEDRRDHEVDLLREYLAARAARGGSGTEVPTWDDAWDAYRRHTLHGLMYALTPPEMQPPEVCAALAGRFAQAAVDHDTLGLLGV